MIQALQMVLNLLRYTVSVDGVLGMQTATALYDLYTIDPKATRALQGLVGLEHDPYIGTDSLQAKVHASARQSGVPESYIRLCLEIENPSTGDFVFIDSSPPFVGLGQFNKPTWKSITSLPFELAVDPDHALPAICELYNRNKISFEALFNGAFSDDIAYLYHNQGAPSAAKFLKGEGLQYPKQSAKALALFKRI